MAFVSTWAQVGMSFVKLRIDTDRVIWKWVSKPVQLVYTLQMSVWPIKESAMTCSDTVGPPSPSEWVGLSASIVWQQQHILAQTSATQGGGSTHLYTTYTKCSIASTLGFTAQWKLRCAKVRTASANCDKATACSAHTMGRRTAPKCTGGF